MTETVGVRQIEVPAMKITFQGPISPEGLGVAFEIAVDATISREELDERLDVVGGARRRQAAIEELPIVRQSLSANLKLLETAKREKARHEAQMNGRVERLQANRRNAAQPSNQDVNALSQHDQRIIQIEGQIEGARERIPYLEAVIAGREPPVGTGPRSIEAAE